MRRLLFLAALLLAVSAEAKPRTKAATKTPIAWDGPILVHDRVPCEQLGAKQRVGLTQGLLGRTDLVEPKDATLTPVAQLEPACREVDVRTGRDPATGQIQYAPQKRVVVDGFATLVLARETLGEVAPQAVDLDGGKTRPVAECTFPPSGTAGCGGPTCELVCSEVTLAGGVRVQTLERRELTHYEETEEMWPVRSWVRVLPFAQDARGWLELDDGISRGMPDDGSWTEGVVSAFVRPGIDARLLLLRSVHCHDAYAVRMVRWNPDGSVQVGRRFAGDPGDEVNEICDQ